MLLCLFSIYWTFIFSIHFGQEGFDQFSVFFFFGGSSGLVAAENNEFCVFRKIVELA